MTAISGRLSFFLVAIFLSLAFFAPEGHGATRTIDYLYIDSSVDEAAGGHAALRFAETVFHYQFYDDGYFLLEKTPWSEFRYQYNDRQNRTLSIASIPVEEEAFEKIKQHFLAQYLVQERRFEILAQLRREEDFLSALSEKKPQIPVKGLGFFDLRSTGAAAGKSLREQIFAVLGPDYLTDIHAELAVRCREIGRDLKPPQLIYGDLDLFRPSLTYRSSIQEYLALRTLYEASGVLLAAHPLLDNTLIDNGPVTAMLGDQERIRLQDHRQELLNSIINLLKTPWTTNGETVLVQTAQYLAISRSLDTGRLITLDPFSDNVNLIPLDKLMATQVVRSGRGIQAPADSSARKAAGSADSYYNLLLRERLNMVQEARLSFQKDENHRALAYAMLEATQAELHELTGAKAGNRELRVQNGPMAPGKVRFIQDPWISTLSGDTTLLAATREYRRQLMAKLLQTYGYNLFTQNCVTELFITLYAAFPSAEEASRTLGGYVDPQSSLFFVPFISFGMVREAFAQSTAQTLPSYRHRYVADRMKTSGMGAFLQESTTLTSTIYYPWREDSVFLFFTDDTFLLRPLYGVINVAYATVGSAAGLLWLPVDQGTLFSRSLKGIVFSLPEICFWNIRKGTFPSVAE